MGRGNVLRVFGGESWDCKPRCVPFKSPWFPISFLVAVVLNWEEFFLVSLDKFSPKTAGVSLTSPYV